MTLTGFDDSDNSNSILIVAGKKIDLEKTKNLNKTRRNLNISAKEFNSWISKDKWDVEPYASFLTKVEMIILEDKERHEFPHAIKNKHKILMH